MKIEIKMFLSGFQADILSWELEGPYLKKIPL